VAPAIATVACPTKISRKIVLSMARSTDRHMGLVAQYAIELFAAREFRVQCCARISLPPRRPAQAQRLDENEELSRLFLRFWKVGHRTPSSAACLDVPLDYCIRYEAFAILTIGAGQNDAVIMNGRSK
jgi:hypothetical protein